MEIESHDAWWNSLSDKEKKELRKRRTDVDWGVVAVTFLSIVFMLYLDLSPFLNPPKEKLHGYTVSRQEIMAQEITSIVINILFASALICGAAAGWLGRSKGYDMSHWFYIGFFFSIIGLIVAAGIGRKKRGDRKSESAKEE